MSDRELWLDADKPPGRAELLVEMPEEVRNEANQLLTEPWLMQTIRNDLANCGIAGEEDLALTLYLIGTSRQLDKPLAGIVTGPTSSGKSYVIRKVASLFPPECIIDASEMTKNALAYLEEGSLVHRFVVAGERPFRSGSEKADAMRLLRELLSEGQVSKLVTVKGSDGDLVAKRFEQKGPIAYVESTTQFDLFAEDVNRCLMLATDERSQQTRETMQLTARRYTAGVNREEIESIVLRHQAIQRMLKPMPVCIPYAERLAELLPDDRPEARRGITQVLSLIEVITLLRQKQRPVDESDGRLLAGPDDYELARQLLAQPMSQLLKCGVSAATQRFFERLQGRAAAGESFTAREVKQHETFQLRTVQGWLHELREANWLRVVEEARGRSPAVYQISDDADRRVAEAIPLPDMIDVFPEPKFGKGS